ncbi:MAG TPA: ABC transporter ATP-binding protein [Acidimicrobiales bacterium]|nr:ABC transporter ATP-binding protein [Acidimicrobiales bacterium]
MTSPGHGSPALSIRNLSVSFDSRQGAVHAVDDVSYEVWPGETLGVVGESGCGKSVTVLTALGLLPQPPGRVGGGQVLIENRDVLGMGSKELAGLRGKEASMIFQDPMTSLHPSYPVITQVMEAVRVHAGDLSASAARDRAVELLELVGVPDARTRAQSYPHEWSGGMRQRAMIAMAVAHHPRVLIADEPTTALDVTVQTQILELLQGLQHEHGLAIVLISHDLGVIAEMADRVVVMYAGSVVETGEVESVFADPRHPYTAGLLASLPTAELEGRRLVAIAGSPPNLAARPSGCTYHPRCPLRQGRQRCITERPRLREIGAGGQVAACHFSEELDKGVLAPDAELEIRQ